MGVHWKKLLGGSGYAQNVPERDILAFKVPKGEIRGILKKDVIINPGEAAVIIKNGKIEDVVAENKINKFGGGLGNWLGRLLGKGEDEMIVFVDTTEKKLEFPVKETSKDRVEIHGVCVIKFKIDPWHTLSLVRNMGHRDGLTLRDLENTFGDELRVAVFSVIGNYNAEEFHGNIDIIRNIEKTAYEWMDKTFAAWGLTPLKIYTNWEKSSYDELMEYKKKVEMEMARGRVDHAAEIDRLEREYELERTKMEKQHDLEIGTIKHEVEKKKVVSDFNREEKIKDFNVEMYQQKSKAQLADEMAKKDIENVLGFTKGMSEVDIEKFKETTLAEEKLQMEHEKEMKGMDVDLEKTKVTQGIQTADEQLKQLQQEIHELEMKMLDAPPEKLAILQRLYEMKTKQFEKAQAEATKRQLGTVGGKSAEEYMKAEAQKYSLNTYKEAEDRERLNQGNVYAQTQGIIGAAQGKQELRCPNCGYPIQPEWTICPHCGYHLKPQKKVCPQCGREVDPSWTICPYCGAVLK